MNFDDKDRVLVPVIVPTLVLMAVFFNLPFIDEHPEIGFAFDGLVILSAVLLFVGLYRVIRWRGGTA
jgi:hypothetical protein